MEICVVSVVGVIVASIVTVKVFNWVVDWIKSKIRG